MIAQDVHAIWSRVLKLEDFSDDDDFFALGGHSLMMTKIQQAISDELGMEVSMDQLFQHPTVTAIADHLQGLSRAEAERPKHWRKTGAQ